MTYSLRIERCCINYFSTYFPNIKLPSKKKSVCSTNFLLVQRDTEAFTWVLSLCASRDHFFSLFFVIIIFLSLDFHDLFHLFGVFLCHFQHCMCHITTGSWEGRGNQYIQLVKVLYCKLPTNGKPLPAFPF